MNGQIKNMIRIGNISSINYEKGYVKVTFDDKQDIVSNELPLLSYEYDMPDIGDAVICIFLGNGIQNGICLGKYYNDKNKPSETGPNIFYKDFRDNANIKYDVDTKILTISAENIVFNGNLAVNGNIYASGNISASGTVTGSNIA